MKLGLTIVQLVSGIIASILILLQAKGTGLGRSIGSSAYHSRRGVENLIFRLTIALVITFVGVSIANQFFL